MSRVTLFVRHDGVLSLVETPDGLDGWSVTTTADPHTVAQQLVDDAYGRAERTSPTGRDPPDNDPFTRTATSPGNDPTVHAFLYDASHRIRPPPRMTGRTHEESATRAHEESATRTHEESARNDESAARHEPGGSDESAARHELRGSDESAAGGGSWVSPTRLATESGRPGAWAAYSAVAPTIERVRTDTTHGSATVSIHALEVLRDTAGAVHWNAPVPSGVGLGDGGRSPVERVERTARTLRTTRPSMAVVRTRIDRVMATADSHPRAIHDRAERAITTAATTTDRVATQARELLDGSVFTLSRSGTVAATLTDTDVPVFVAVSEPGGEGRTVAERLASDRRVTCLPDTAVAALIRRENPTVLLGADTVDPDGGVWNKIGTRHAVRAAHDAECPVIVVTARDKIAPANSTHATDDSAHATDDSTHATDDSTHATDDSTHADNAPTRTNDASTQTNDAPMRTHDEPASPTDNDANAAGDWKTVAEPNESFDPPSGCGAFAPTFERVPPESVTLVTETGVTPPSAVRQIARDHADLTSWTE